ADETAPVPPVAGHQGLTLGVEQVQHGGTGCSVELLQTLVQRQAQLAIMRCAQQTADVAVQRQHFGHRTETLDQGANGLGVQLQLPSRLDAALVPGSLLSVAAAQPEAYQQAGSNRQNGERDAIGV